MQCKLLPHDEMMIETLLCQFISQPTNCEHDKTFAKKPADKEGIKKMIKKKKKLSEVVFVVFFSSFEINAY